MEFVGPAEVLVPFVELGTLGLEFGLDVSAIFLVNDELGVGEGGVLGDELGLLEFLGLAVAHNIVYDRR